MLCRVIIQQCCFHSGTRNNVRHAIFSLSGPYFQLFGQDRKDRQRNKHTHRRMGSETQSQTETVRQTASTLNHSSQRKGQPEPILLISFWPAGADDNAQYPISTGLLTSYYISGSRRKSLDILQTSWVIIFQHPVEFPVPRVLLWQRLLVCCCCCCILSGRSCTHSLLSNDLYFTLQCLWVADASYLVV